jgi:hypothetical protein
MPEPHVAGQTEESRMHIVAALTSNVWPLNAVVPDNHSLDDPGDGEQPGPPPLAH